MIIHRPLKSSPRHSDNRELAEVLRAIPVEGTVIATNDLRYPASDFRGADCPFQFASLYGHQNFGANLRIFPRENHRFSQSVAELLIYCTRTNEHWSSNGRRSDAD